MVQHKTEVAFLHNAILEEKIENLELHDFKIWGEKPYKTRAEDPESLFGFCGFSFGGWVGIREVFLIGEPETGEKIRKSTNAGSIANVETGDDGMQMVFLEVSGPFRIRNDFKFYRHKDRTEHIGREPGCRAKSRIAVLHEGIHFRKVKVPELLHNVPSMCRERGSSIRIIFTQLRQDTVLIGGMSANVYGFHKKRPPNSKNVVCSGRRNRLPC